jgi:hypothetical protein
MKKFKGGLYADLGNYKTNLPNTEILNNFFASNPVGYKSGGMVKGISGGNSTGMKVTGGFLNRAQNMQSGGDVSAYYGKKGDSIRPGRLESQAIGDLYVYEPSLPYGKGPDLENPDYGKVMTKQQAKDAGFRFDAKGGMLNPFSDLRKGDPSKEKSALDGIRFPEEKPTPTEFSPEREDYISKLAAKNIAAEKRKLQDPNRKQAAEDMLSVGITSLAGTGDSKKVKKFKSKNKKSGLKDADNIVSEGVDVNYKENKGNTLTKPDNNIDTNVESPDMLAKLDKRGVFDTKDNKEIFNEMFDRDKFDKILSNQQNMTKESIDGINAIGKDFYEGKDDAPAWAMPLMMAGLKMAASDNPSMLGALAEGGISGMEDYAKKQAQKREDAKDQIQLEMQKMSAIINLKAQDIDVEKEFAVLETNTKSDAYTLAFDDYKSTKQNIFAAIEAQTGFDIGSEEFKVQSDIALAELNQRYDVAIAQLDKDYAAMEDRKSEFKTDTEYKNKLLEIESVKIYNENLKHENLLELEKVSEGKITSVLMPDDDNNFKEYKIRTYYDFDTGEYETDVIGFAPPDSDYLENLENEIRTNISDGFYEELEGKSIEEIESFIADLVQKRINKDYGNIKETETEAGG